MTDTETVDLVEYDDLQRELGEITKIRHLLTTRVETILSRMKQIEESFDRLNARLDEINAG